MQAVITDLIDKHKSMQTNCDIPSTPSVMDYVNSGDSASVEVKEQTYRDVDMESALSVRTRKAAVNFVQFDSGDSDEDEGMSVHSPYEPNLLTGSNTQSNMYLRTREGFTAAATIHYDGTGDRAQNAQLTSPSARCVRCEAYDAHCKSAAENYRRVLGKYTKTVSELLVGFRQVLD